MPIVNSVKEVAKICHRTAKTIDIWISEGMPRQAAAEKGRFEYDTEAILTWRMTRDVQVAREEASLQDQRDNRTKRQEQIRKLKIQNDNLESQSLRERGELYHRVTVKECFGAFFGELGTCVKSLKRQKAKKQADLVAEHLRRAMKKVDAIIDRAIRELKK